MYRHRFCGQHPFARLQEPTHSYPQGIQRYSPKGQLLAGLVLRFQASSDLQREGELLNFMITPGDVNDRKPLEYKNFVEFIYEKPVGDTSPAAYCCFPKKPCSNVQRTYDIQPSLF